MPHDCALALECCDHLRPHDVRPPRGGQVRQQESEPMASLAERTRTQAHEHGQEQEAAARNPGMPLDLARIEAVQVNRSAVERRAATLPARRTVKKEWQAAWLLRAITCID